MSTSDPRRPAAPPPDRDPATGGPDPVRDPSPGTRGPDPVVDPAPGTHPVPAHRDRPADRPADRPVDGHGSHAPRTTGPGGHVLGVLVGFVLTLVAVAVLTLGMSRILAANGVGAESVVLDGLGVALVSVGAVVAALVALLAVRTSAIPFTGGLVALVLGAAYLFAPEGTHAETVRLLATEQNTDTVLSMLTVCLVGVPFTVGLILLASGTAASLVRRRGIAVGSFRERSQASAGAR